MNSFKFDLSRKLDSKLENKKIQDALEPKSKIDIKNKLKNGGDIVLSAPDIERLIEIPENFLSSQLIPSVKFTNFVNLRKVPESTRETLEKIIDDVSYICENNESVDFSQTNTRTLRTVLKTYGITEVLNEENESFFKIDGVSHYDSGQKENPFRIYMKIDSSHGNRTKYRLIFCDIYHLCLISEHNGLSAEQVRDQTYIKYRYGCINHLKELLDVKKGPSTR